MHTVTGQTFSVQEKYRQNSYLRFGDFTQEYMNGNGTKGEWFHLNAQLYFYGWARDDCNGFEKWFVMDIMRYKMIVEDAGGLDQIGSKQVNRLHGSSVFYGIRLEHIAGAMLYKSP